MLQRQNKLNIQLRGFVPNSVELSDSFFNLDPFGPLRLIPLDYQIILQDSLD